jgi:hypothetical protein
MSCRAWEELLQQHLDGEGQPDSLDQHLDHCADCSAHRPGIHRLRAGLELLRPALPPANLEERITARLLTETAPRPLALWKRRFPPLAGLAAAAALLLAVGLWVWQSSGLPNHPEHAGGPAVRPEPPKEPPALPAEPLGDSLGQARSAVVALTSRTASETVDRTSTLLPLVRQSSLEPLAPMSTPLEPPLEPFREATSGVSAGLAPLADSALRAVGLFLRDLPGGSTQ